ncbi:response regulator [Halalkalibacter akibai]|uniref:Circadian input-output histidine kinase CikA n=1 Tax=Halalkalibacter akibai (strain ATCC 43226 / DSM 21942 / CIP 109018 / JCM 9157 / 1139) TaxID=1236973 RepID=W4QTP1_HALA3|nr:response regulator [Halalkalibacter akibai]GAE35292.1 signal transduction histidine kinase [Halalkalibacter akibai JCM 9157]
MKLKTKLIISLGTITLIILALSATVIFTMDRQHETMRNLIAENYARVMVAEQIKNETNFIAREVRELLLTTSESQQNEKITLINESLQGIGGTFQTLEQMSIGDSEKLQRIASIQTSHGNYTDMILTVMMTAMNEGNEAASEFLLNQNIRQQILQEVDELVSQEEQVMITTYEESTEAYEYAMLILTIFIILSIAIVIIITYITIKNITKSINTVRKVITSVPSHSLEQLPRIAVTSKDEVGDISIAYNEMAASLEKLSINEKQLADELKEENWIKTRYAEIAMKFQGIADLSEFGNVFMINIAQFVKATHGVLYIKDESQKLQRIATYATSNGSIEPELTVEFGHGLVGQCAADSHSMYIEPLPKGYISTQSGLGEATPTSLLLVPIEFEGEVLGVLEVAKFESFSKSEISIVEQVCKVTGTSIERILDHMKIEELLAESQTQSEELQTQSEELQQQQEELRLINEQLHEQYKQSDARKKELEKIKEDLEDKNKSIKLGSRYKSEFLANMSHELRTPLNSMLILSQILAENQYGNLTEKQVEHASTIYSSGKDLLELINDILDLSKIESGKVDIYPEEVLVEDVQAFVKRQFMPISNQKNIDFKIRVDEKAPAYIFTDDQRLKQILKNLLSNAFKFTSKGSVELYVKKGIEKQGMKISFSVLDTGIGISEEKQQQIFEAFYQEDGTITRKYGGTGLGLSISRELSELLGGYIEVESVEGRGSVFTLHIPDLNDLSVLQEVAVTKEEVKELEVVDETEKITNPLILENLTSEPIQNRGELENKTVLVVDDDMRNVFALTAALEMHNMNVVFAENGKEALNILDKETDIDIILMDIMMPEMNGYETMQAIRQDHQWGEVPIIALTAKAMKNDREKCIQAGASDYISKPVNMEQLLSLIKVWLYK